MGFLLATKRYCAKSEPDTNRKAEPMRKLVVIDWEYTQHGHRATDLGQMIGDLCERKHFNDVAASMWIIQGFVLKDMAQ